MLNNFTPHSKKIAITVIGYTNLNLLGKRQTLKIYTSKSDLIAAEKMQYNENKTFINQFAAVLKGEALKTKFWAAKKVLRLYRWTFQNYCNLLTALRKLRNFNNSVSKDLKVSIY